MHFWCNFLGIKKVYKVENQLLVDYSERRGRDWLLRSRWSLRLTPFPSARRRGPCKPISLTSMSYISLSTNLVANCDIQVDGTKVADIFDLPKFEAKKMTLEESKGYIRRVFTFQKFTFRVKRRGAGLNHLQSKNLTPYPSSLSPLEPLITSHLNLT